MSNNKGRKLKRFKVYVGRKCMGQELAFTKTNALKNVRKRFGRKAWVRQIKY